MINSSFIKIIAAISLLLITHGVLAGGNLIQLDPADTSQVIEKKWDSRMLPITWVLSSDGNPNSGMSNQDIVDEMTAAFDTWQNVASSQLAFTYGGEVDRRSSGIGGQLGSGIDGYNLVTFTDPDVIFPPGVVGLALTFSFTADVTIDNSNNDLNSDGSPDLANGLYPKGTIFDGDIIFNSSLNYSTTGANGTLDLRAIALHEIGHFFGLSHSSVGAAVMFPFLAFDVLSARTPKLDDLGYASFFYPREPDYSTTYGTISGRITNGFDGFRILGAHVYAVDSVTGETIAGAYSGIDGSYTIPVPSGNYFVAIEPLDGDPPALDPTRINSVIAPTLDTFFTEEFYDVNEANVEADPMERALVTVSAGANTPNIDIVTNTVDVPGISLVLQEGENYISYPVSVPTGLTAFELLDVLGSETEINAIDRFNTQTGLFERALFQNGNIVGVDFSIERGQGYLLHSQIQKIVTFAGSPDCPDISVEPGLNMIGVPCPPATYSGYDLLESLGSEFEVNSVKRYDDVNHIFEMANYLGGSASGTDFIVANGEAYLVDMAVGKSRVSVPSQGQIFPPAISGISPGRGVPGSNVLIIGQGFSDTFQDNLVVFNGVGAPVLFSTPNLLSVQVPATATTGPVTVTVDGRESNHIEFIVESATVTESLSGTTEIVNGQTASGNISRDGEQDRYTFLALEGSLATLSATAAVSGAPDLMLILEGPSGVFLISDDDSGPGTDPLINGFVLPETGIYTIVVTNVSGSGIGAYDLSIDISTITGNPKLSALNGGVQTGLAGTVLSSPFEILLTSSAGMPLAGVPVTFTASNIEFEAGGSPINAGTTTVTTNGNGIASVSATLPNTPGTFDIVVTPVGIPGASPVTLRVGSTATLVTSVVISGNGQNCGGSGCEVNTALPEDYVVTYRDINDNPVSNVLTDWALVSGSGSITPAGNQTTGANGESRVRHTLGQKLYFDNTVVRIPQSVAATVPGQAAPILFGATARAGSPSRIEQNRTDFRRMTVNTSALSAIYITVTDQFDNPVEDATISANSSDLTIAPGLFEAEFLTDFTTNEEGIWVGLVSAGGVTPSVDEFGNTGGNGLASTYNFSVSAGSASVSYDVDVDMGPNMVTSSQQGASESITKELGQVSKVVFRYQRIDSYPGSGQDDDGGDWTNDTDFSPSNLRFVPIDGVVINLEALRQDGEDETSVGEAATQLNGQSQVTVTTDSTGIASADVTLGGVAGAISVRGRIPSPITVEFRNDDNPSRGQNGQVITSQQFTDENNYAESTSINARAVELVITLDDTPGTLSANQVGGVVPGSVNLLLNGSSIYDADGTRPDYNKFPHFARIILDGTEQTTWPTGDVLTNGGIGEIQVIYQATGSQLNQGANTLTVDSGLIDGVSNENTSATNHSFNF